MRSARRFSQQDTPARRLIAALGLEPRPAAEVQDLYNRPIVAGPDVLRLETRRQTTGRPDLAA